MPASLPGDDRVTPAANPSAGQFVIFDPLSGPKGSPLDSRKITFSATGTPSYAFDPTQKNSTGALNTGIGIGPNHLIGLTPGLPVTSPTLYAIFKAGFSDDMQPGQVQAYTAAPPPGNTSSNTVNSTRMYIGGGKTTFTAGTGANGNGAPANWRVAATVPYTAGISIVGAGNGASRDAGAGPAFSGFALKMVTAAGAVANGAAIEGAFINRSGMAMTTGQSAFGSSNVALGAAS